MCREAGEELAHVLDQQVRCLAGGIVAAPVVVVPGHDAGALTPGQGAVRRPVVRELGQAERHGQTGRNGRRAARWLLPVLLGVDALADPAVPVSQWIMTWVSSASGSRSSIAWLFHASSPTGESASAWASVCG